MKRTVKWVAVMVGKHMVELGICPTPVLMLSLSLAQKMYLQTAMPSHSQQICQQQSQFSQQQGWYNPICVIIKCHETCHEFEMIVPLLMAIVAPAEIINLGGTFDLPPDGSM